MLVVSRVSSLTPIPVGAIDEDRLVFSYDSAYLDSESPIPLSLSLPLKREPFPLVEWRPYFEGLLAEGGAREALAAELQLPENDWFGLLAACARDCVGDVLIRPDNEVVNETRSDYTPISLTDIRSVLGSAPSTADSNAQRRLSLAGAQSKTGFAHDPSRKMDEGWLVPEGLAATTHILKASYLRDVPEIEFICMSTARACGIETAEVSLLGLGNPVLAVKRFDRSATLVDNELRVKRLHQEDMAQAFGVTPASKYAELEGGSIAAMARLIRERSARPAVDLTQLARMTCFSYLIGNCDAHLKNFSLIYREEHAGGTPLPRLAPAYDFVCTTRYERFSRNMAMSMGGVRAIDDVTPDALERLARDLGITNAALRKICRSLADDVESAIVAAGNGEMGQVVESTPYIAEDLIEDMAARRTVLQRFCL